jgi:hypothetical protein
MDHAHELKRPLLYVLAASVVVAVVLSIAVVVQGEWRGFEVRVLMSTTTLAGACFCILACDVARTQRGYYSLPRAGMVLAAVAAGTILLAIWFPGRLFLRVNLLWQSTVCIAIFAIATAHVCLLSVARVALRFRWAQILAYVAIFGLALLIACVFLQLLGTTRPVFSLIAALSILSAGLTVLLPILHRISKTDPTTPLPLGRDDETNIAAIDDEIVELKTRILKLEIQREELVRRR